MDRDEMTFKCQRMNKGRNGDNVIIRKKGR